MTHIAHRWIAGLLVAASTVWSAVAEPIRIENGLVEGVLENGSRVFKGVPFATAPVGELRWRAPQAPPTWSEIKTADAFSPICPQIGMYPPDAPPEPMSEDCLYLNVWAPAATATKKLPVMVWFHGGALQNGSASTPLYWAHHFTKRNFIVVTANYRLGALGFLALPALSEEAEYGSSGNYGLLDQIAALRWINRNIESFGGDPMNVTVFGQSSGAISISALVTSPLTKGLFHRAIGQSGGLFEPISIFPKFGLRGAEQQGEEFLARAGAESLTDLRQKSPTELMNTMFDAHLIVDGFALPKSPHDAYRDGEQNHVDLLVGSNADEGEIFLIDKTVTRENYTKVLSEHFTRPLVWLMAPDPGEDDQAARAAAVAFEGDMRFRWDMWQWAQLGSNAAQRKVFLYQFSHTPPFGSSDRYVGMGATHGLEMPYVFENLDQQDVPWARADLALASTMSAYWANFAAFGDPNGPGLPEWPAYDPTAQHAMIFGEASGAARVPNLKHLQRIDRGYSALRFAHNNLYLLLGILCLMICGSVIAVVLIVRARRASPYLHRVGHAKGGDQ